VNRKIATIAIIVAFVGGMIFAGVPVEAKKGGGGNVIDEVFALIMGLDTRVSELESSVTLSSLECIENQVAVYNGTHWECFIISVSAPTESVEIFGYDATDGNSTRFHDGVTGNVTTGATNLQGLEKHEYIAVYLRNDSVTKVFFSEIRLAGTVYEYETGSGTLPNSGMSSGIDAGFYQIVLEGNNDSNLPETLVASVPEMQPGQHLTVVLSLDKDLQVGLDFQFLMTTTKGTIAVEMINIGSQIGS